MSDPLVKGSAGYAAARTAASRIAINTRRSGSINLGIHDDAKAPDRIITTIPAAAANQPASPSTSGRYMCRIREAKSGTDQIANPAAIQRDKRATVGIGCCSAPSANLPTIGTATKTPADAMAAIIGKSS